MSLYIDSITGLVGCQENFELQDGNRDWKKRKVMSLNVAKLMKEYDPVRGEMIRLCGTYLSFNRTPDGKMSLYTANFCRQRLCPMCQWRRSIKIRTQADQMFRVLAAEGYRAVFLSLTQKNCKAEDLTKEVDRLYQAVREFQNLKSFRKSFDGFYRAFEITYNADEDTYHPHFHYLLIVKPEYFDRESGLYWTHEQLVRRWRRILDLDYDPRCHIEVVTQKPGQSITSACAEMCKYPTKTAEIRTSDVLRTVDYALRGRRLVAWGGVCAKVRRQLSLDDAEDGDLIHTDENATAQADDVPVEKVVYIWRQGLYLPMDVKPL